jgi:site-specific DNA-cytosine methylase
MPTFYEFFAGGGMARAGLGGVWQCLFANDFDETKAKSYVANWGKEHLVVDDVRNLMPNALPGIADLIWSDPVKTFLLQVTVPDLKVSVPAASGHSGIR